MSVKYNLDELKAVQKGLRARLFEKDEIELLTLKFVKAEVSTATAYRIVPNAYINSGHTPESTVIYFTKDKDFNIELHYKREETECSFSRSDFDRLASDIVIQYNNRRIVADMSRLDKVVKKETEEIKIETEKVDKQPIKKDKISKLEQKIISDNDFSILIKYVDKKRENNKEINKSIISEQIENISKNTEIEDIEYVEFIVSKYINL